MKYMAEDGTIFKTEQECYNYETTHSLNEEDKTLEQVRRIWNKKITLYNKQGKTEEIYNYVYSVINNKEWIAVLETVLSGRGLMGVFYLDINVEPSEKWAIQYINDGCGFDIPLTPDYYHYDDATEQWVGFQQEKDTLNTHWATIGLAC